MKDIEFDRKHIWHPYTSMINPLHVYHVVSAQGCELKLDNGKILIDGMSSWWSAIHGYNHPNLNAAMKKQIDLMSHVMFGGITHKPAIELCKKLISITSDKLECVFLADSGSVAIEIAMKMALQYWQAIGEGKKRKRFLSFRNAYHGDTFGAISICDPYNSIHSLWQDYIPKNIFAPAPKSRFDSYWDEKDLINVIELINEHRFEIAALVIEPIVQGAGGMKIYHPKYLKCIREICDHEGILLILDEIATGFGRTGKLFAYEHSNISPDILCLGKALTGGTMTLSATITTRHIANTISNGKVGFFMHGPTFMGNPLACAVANESISLLDNGLWYEQVQAIEEQLKKELLMAKYSKYVVDVRIIGAIGVVETIAYVNLDRLQSFFVEKGVWIRPFGKLIYLMPPYLISKNQLSKLINSIIDAVNISEHFIFKN